MAQTTIERLCGYLAERAPLRMAESWDNVGLLVGDRKRPANRVMTCLTITPAVVEEAVAQKADLIVTHHPLPFKPVAKITTDTITGKLLLQLAGGNVAVYCAHTAFDSAATGINQALADKLKIAETAPLNLFDVGDPAQLGSGRYGKLPEPTTLDAVARRVAKQLGCSAFRFVGQPDQPVAKIAFACGSGGSFLSRAAFHRCDAMVTGEASFHSCLEAEALGIGLILVGHYQSERFAMEELAHEMAGEFPDCQLWCSERDQDPLQTVVL